MIFVGLTGVVVVLVLGWVVGESVVAGAVLAAAVRRRHHGQAAERDRVPAGQRRVAGGASAARESPVGTSAPDLPDGARADGLPVVGYAIVRGGGGDREFRQQAEAIARECERRGLELLELVREREPAVGEGLRPGLGHALERISSRQAQGLVVAEFSRLTSSAAELGAIIQWLTHYGARLVVAEHALDTESEAGRLAARILVKVLGWERERLSERTRKGLRAAVRGNGRTGGRPAVTGDPELRERIRRMRAEGMSLQAIADRLNEDGVPTFRGGSKWRHSSVQAAAGYKRPRPKPFNALVATITDTGRKAPDM